jgi:phospholipid/cholesterol/gamma-HCH transport system substrate-binding protein
VRSLELKVGAFALAIIILLGYMTFKVGDIDLFSRNGYTIYVYFSNLAGLDRKTKVRVSGVDAGLIDSVHLEDGRVKIKVRMWEGVKLYSDATASIKFTGLLGDKFLAINPGAKSPVLKDGDTVITTIEPTDIDNLIQNFSKLSTEISRLAVNINAVVGAEESEQALKETIVNLRDITRNLNAAVINNDKSLKMVLGNVRELSASLNDLISTNRESLSTTLANLRDFSSSLKEDGKPLVRDLDSAARSLRDVIEENRPALKEAVENLNAITQKIESGEGTLGRLVNDERLYDKTTAAAEEAHKTFSTFNRFKAFLILQGEYLSKPKSGKGYLTVDLQPTRDDHFILSLVSNPAGKVLVNERVEGGSIVKEEQFKNQVQFTGQYGRRFSQVTPLQNTMFRVGLKENTFGVGADQYFLEDKLKVSLDVWNFNRNEPTADKPHLRAGADYFIFKHIFITAGIDDALNSKRRGAFIGSGLRFGNSQEKGGDVP